MKGSETPGNIGAQLQPRVGKQLHRRQGYQKVFDGRKRPIRGLWVRNQRFYARIAVPDSLTGVTKVRRIPLSSAVTVADAQAALRSLLTRREEDMLPSLKRTPKFREYVEDYFAHYAAAQHEKRSSTLATERVHLNAWVQHLGGVRLEDITQGMIDKFLAKRQAEAVSPRTVNLALTCLRNVLNRAKTAKLITQLPTDGFRPLKWLPRQRQLFSAAEIEMLCAAAFNPVYQGGNLAPRGERGVPLKNAQQFADFIELLASCGSRMSDRAQLSGPVEC